MTHAISPAYWAGRISVLEQTARLYGAGMIEEQVYEDELDVFRDIEALPLTAEYLVVRAKALNHFADEFKSGFEISQLHACLIMQIIHTLLGTQEATTH
jgi:hypothetical protein